MADILLIEPAYKNKYPPIALMKIAYFHRYIHHDYVMFTKGELPPVMKDKKWDRVYVTTLFTFEWKHTRAALEYGTSVVRPNGRVYTGGVLATLMPDLIKENFPTIINTGLLNVRGTLELEHDELIDTLPLDYSILDDIKEKYVYPANNAYFTYMTRGCGMKCGFCAVQTLEPKYYSYISITDSIKRIDKEFGVKKDLLLMDNNVLRSPKFDVIVDEIISLGFGKGSTYKNPITGKTVHRYVDFNQGLDANLLTEHKAKRLGELAIHPARIAFDHIEDEAVYKNAISLCAKEGITHMSNYLLYNGVDFTGKGHSYKADKPEDLYYRMKLTMDLGEELSREVGKKVCIFSFPMRYIPLDETERGFVGVNWNAKFLRALQCMLIPTQGKGVQSRSFFEADFGSNEKEFIEYLTMPERLLTKRGFFTERKNENKSECELRRIKWRENQQLINTWEKLYTDLDKNELLKYVAVNKFNHLTLDSINSLKMKKIYILYLSMSEIIKVFTECNENTCALVKTYIKDELPFLYERVVEKVATTSIKVNQINGMFNWFGRDFIIDVLKKANLFNNSRAVNCIIKANAKYKFIDFDFSLLKLLPVFDKENIFSETEQNRLLEAVYDFNQKRVMDILRSKLNLFKESLLMNMESQPGYNKLIMMVEEEVKGVYKQLTFFDEDN